MAKRGPKPSGNARDNVWPIRLNDPEADTVTEAVTASGLDRGTWMRERLLKTAKRENRLNRRTPKPDPT